MDYDKYKLDYPENFDEEFDSNITLDVSIKGDPEKIKKFEQFIEGIAEKLGLDLEY